MLIANFIRANIEPILQEWDKHPSVNISAGTLNKNEIRNIITLVLKSIATDLDGYYKNIRQSKLNTDIKKDIKGATKNIKLSLERIDYTLLVDLSLNETMSLFSVLRTCVITLWSRTHSTFKAAEIQDITHFNQAIDQAIAKSMSNSSKQRLLQDVINETGIAPPPEQIFIFDLEHKFSYVNRAGLEIYNMPKEVIIGKNFLDFKFTFTKELHQWLKKVIDTQKIISGEVVYPNRSIERRVFEYILAPIINKNHQIEAIVGISRDITDRKASEEEGWYQANYDALTGLPNRRLFQDRLEQDIKHAERTGLPLVLMFIDLDHFKEVNDALGHEAGDDLLKQVSMRINSCIRKADTVARLSGDEFTIILTEVTGVNQITTLSQKIVRELAKPFKLKDSIAKISCSLGITFFPNDATSAEELLKNADTAMYKAKAAGRNQISFFCKN